MPWVGLGFRCLSVSESFRKNWENCPHPSPLGCSTAIIPAPMPSPAITTDNLSCGNGEESMSNAQASLAMRGSRGTLSIRTGAECWTHASDTWRPCPAAWQPHSAIVSRCVSCCLAAQQNGHRCVRGRVGGHFRPLLGSASYLCSLPLFPLAFYSPYSVLHISRISLRKSYASDPPRDPVHSMHFFSSGAQQTAYRYKLLIRLEADH